ncbi:hypothetical protein JX265_013546 [Neoarthrinium moseri]|uniref:Beta-lactamase-related domain-containing protein n=1 Tax=Neoarthrinium moseri TaxID=1658444 RepID=A0A9Q0AIL9_9PEZI|nr:hypothetical protein JX266_006813 [Neoarthrinium moseri]KAI1849843.1 hypothetical protein JX265_013546 [Neoarthrinium moseri]
MAPQLAARVALEAQLAALLENGIAAGVPGFAAAITSSKDLLWQSNAGLSDLLGSKPIDKDSSFGIGSITKTFVAVVILQLLDEGRLGLRDTVGRFLRPEVYRGIENAEGATVSDLLRHRAGVDSWEDDPVWIRDGRGDRLKVDHIWSKTEPLGYIRRPRIEAPDPGQWYYSNTNFTLLGLIIEAVTNSPAEEEIRRRILEPLGMEHTYMEGFEPPNSATVPRRYHWATSQFRDAAGINDAFEEVRDNIIDTTGSNLSTEWTAGGLVSSIPDMLKFCLALRDGKLLSPTSLGLMKDWKPTTESHDFGRGLFRVMAPDTGTKWIGHFGSVLGFTAGLVWQEEGDCAVCVLANVGTVHSEKVPSSAAGVVLRTNFLNIASRLAEHNP